MSTAVRGYRAIGNYVPVDNQLTTPSLAELVSTLSIASDLGIGRPIERVLRLVAHRGR